MRRVSEQMQWRVAGDYLCRLKVMIDERRQQGDTGRRGCQGVAVCKEAYERLFARRCQRGAPASESQDI